MFLKKSFLFFEKSIQAFSHCIAHPIIIGTNIGLIFIKKFNFKYKKND
jgi:hypothetical protein